ncbi:MAG: AMP-binding protein [Acetobacteraceae bacterium]
MTETVAAAFAATAARYPARPFLHVLEETATVYGTAPGALTYGDAVRDIGRLRAAYAAAGYGAGHRVGLMLENRPTFFLHWLALNGLGATVVPLNAALRPGELDYLVTHSGIALCVSAVAHAAKLQAAVQRTGASCQVISEIGTPPPAGRAMLPDRACAILYTSGTTGRPKGCMLSNDYYLRMGRWYMRAGSLCTLHPSGDRLLTPLPLFHMNAIACSAMVMILSGGCLIQLDRFHPRSWWQSVHDSGATIIHYLGVMPSMLLSAPPTRNDRDHAIRFGFGAGVDRKHHAAFEARFGFPLLEAWAMTETGSGACVIANIEPRHVGTNCFGRPGPELDIRIVDDSGSPCPPGTPGELLVRATGADPRAGFFSAYLDDPRATDAAWDGGRFHTGDIVRSDEQGNLYFVDRKKNVIRRSGENISAVEVESMLRSHHLVADVAVAAAPDDVRGEEVLACIIPRAPIADQDRTEAAASIVRAALQDMSYFKVPGWIAFVDALPLTASQKVSRGELKEWGRRLAASGECIDTRALKRRA